MNGKIGSRLLAWGLAFGLLAGVFPARAMAMAYSVPVPYLDETGARMICADPAAITAETAVLNTGWYYVTGELSYPSRLVADGDVHIILGDGAYLNTGNGGIDVAQTSSLTIYAQSEGASMGRLDAAAAANDAGIGSAGGQTGGTIVINGGRVSATGAGSGAGIGGGGNGGIVVINGGDVTAFAPGGGGIGGGLMYGGAFIIVNGGNVTTTGGPGDAGMDATQGRTITINGGTVTSRGGSWGAFSNSLTVTAPTYTYWSNTTQDNPGGPGTRYPESGEPYISSTGHKFARIDVEGEWDENAPAYFYGVLSQYSGGVKAPLANAELSLYNRVYELLETVTTDENGSFTYVTTNLQASKDGVYALVNDGEKGTLLKSDETGFCAGQLYRLAQSRSNALTYLYNSHDRETNGFLIVGTVKDSGGAGVAGASIKYINEVAVTGADGSFSFLIDSDWLRYHSPGFTVEKEGYRRSSFYADTTGPQAAISLLANGYIDAGTVELSPVEADSPFEHGSVTAWNRVAKPGETVQVSVQYRAKEDLPGAVLSVSVPEGVVIVPNSASNEAAVIDGGSLILTETIPADTDRSLLFWVRAESGYGGDFTIEAFAETTGAAAGKWRIGGDAVSLAKLSLDIPAEINLDENGDSMPFTVRGEAPAADGYTVDIFFAGPDGEPALLSESLTGLPAKSAAKQFRVQDVRILNAAENPGDYTVRAVLRDSSGGIAGETETRVYISPDAVVATGIRMWSNYFNVTASGPVSASTFAAACVYMDEQNFNRDPIYAQIEMDNVNGVEQARFVAETPSGFFHATESSVVSIDEDGHGVFYGRFDPGSFYGTGTIKFGLQLSWEAPEEAEPKHQGPSARVWFPDFQGGRDGGVGDGNSYSGFFPPSYWGVGTPIHDPSGYVFDSVTGERVEGATATLQILENEEWADWPAEEYYQNNNQITGSGGEYGWFVPEGSYRVLVRAEGYEDYATDADPKYGVITVLPPRTDINIGLTPVDASAPSVSLIGSSAAAAGEDVSYSVSVSNMKKLATATVWFEVEDAFFTGKAFTGQNGFRMIGGVQWTKSGDKWIGRATVGAMNGGVDITDARDILEMTFTAKEALGETNVKLTKIGLSGYDDKGEAAFIETGFNGASVTTKIEEGLLPCDVNRDGKVDQLDLTAAQLFYRAGPDSGNWDEAVKADVKADGVIDIEDYILILNSISW